MFIKWDYIAYFSGPYVSLEETISSLHGAAWGLLTLLFIHKGTLTSLLC